eukprot:4942754-Pyramimonas_sp.AAC.1
MCLKPQRTSYVSSSSAQGAYEAQPRLMSLHGRVQHCALPDRDRPRWRKPRKGYPGIHLCSECQMPLAQQTKIMHFSPVMRPRP